MEEVNRFRLEGEMVMSIVVGRRLVVVPPMAMVVVVVR